MVIAKIVMDGSRKLCDHNEANARFVETICGGWTRVEEAGRRGKQRV